MFMVKSKATVVLELLGKAQSDFYGSEGAMTDRFFTFFAYGYEICNPFRDELNLGDVEPIEYYGYSFLGSNMYNLIKSQVSKYDTLDAEEIAEELIDYVTYRKEF